jgi:hypothetical protein
MRRSLTLTASTDRGGVTLRKATRAGPQTQTSRVTSLVSLHTFFSEKLIGQKIHAFYLDLESCSKPEALLVGRQQLMKSDSLYGENPSTNTVKYSTCAPP